jgi:3'-phosphoadenosine 5'-phosphosulfate sulfotransferase (PAPS reductase)/FAD synthetase
MMVKYKLSSKELDERLAWSFDRKIDHFVFTYCEYFIEMVVARKVGVYLSFSGGKDSQVGCDIIERIHKGEFNGINPEAAYVSRFPMPPRVFCNTGLEFPEIVDHVKTFDNVTIMKPLMGFPRVIKEVGVAVGSKMVAEMVERLKGYIANPSASNEATKTLYLTGIRKDGTESKGSKLSNRWMRLLEAPFPVSNKCCDIFKKEPFHRYQKQTGRVPVFFTSVVESNRRKTSYMQTGCTTFDKGKEACRPYSIFTDEDTWAYHDQRGIRFCEVYYDRQVAVEQLDGSKKIVALEGEKRTGCTFCLFGIHLEDKKKPNRIQRLAISHPKYYDIIINKCGLGDILQWLKIPYKPFKVVCQASLFKQRTAK